MRSQQWACWPKVIANLVQEGEQKIVDFADDEPHVVEGLLIYLYTLEYPIRKLDKFERSATNGNTPAPVLPASRSTNIEVYKKPANLLAQEGAVEDARFTRKSVAPEELWQEHMGLYRIADRLGLTSLAATSLGMMTRLISDALCSSNVKEFIKALYDLEQDAVQEVKGDVVEGIAYQEPCVVSQDKLDNAIICYPLFGCDLVKAMREHSDRQS
jgi:hypothetical protein